MLFIREHYLDSFVVSHRVVSHSQAGTYLDEPCVSRFFKRKEIKLRK